MAKTKKLYVQKGKSLFHKGALLSEGAEVEVTDDELAARIEDGTLGEDQPKAPEPKEDEGQTAAGKAQLNALRESIQKLNKRLDDVTEELKAVKGTAEAAGKAASKSSDDDKGKGK